MVLSDFVLLGAFSLEPCCSQWCLLVLSVLIFVCVLFLVVVCLVGCFGLTVVVAGVLDGGVGRCCLVLCWCGLLWSWLVSRIVVLSCGIGVRFRIDVVAVVRGFVARFARLASLLPVQLLLLSSMLVLCAWCRFFVGVFVGCCFLFNFVMV